MQKAHTICFLYLKKKKNCFLRLGMNQDIQTIGLLMYFFSQCEIKERTVRFVVYFLGLITL